jgi:MFS family permease
MTQNDNSAKVPDMEHGIAGGVMYSGVFLFMIGTLCIMFTNWGSFGVGILSSGFYCVVVSLVMNWKNKRDLLEEEGKKARAEIEELIKP